MIPQALLVDFHGFPIGKTIISQFSLQEIPSEAAFHIEIISSAGSRLSNHPDYQLH